MGPASGLPPSQAGALAPLLSRCRPCPPLAADGRRIAAGGMDGTVALFDAATGKLLHTLDGHFKPVRDLTFTPGRPPCSRP